MLHLYVKEVVNGLGRHLELQAKARQAEEEKRLREREVRRCAG